MGVSWDDFWRMNPFVIKALVKGYKQSLQHQDYISWLSGQYTLSAVSVAIEHCFAKRSKLEYIKEPLLANEFEDDGLTQEQIDERELRKMILAEDEWIRVSKAKGLPETII